MSPTHSPKQAGWYAELDKADQLRHIWRIDDEGAAELVAVVIGDSDDDYDPVPAQRAHLIAAAPDFYMAADAIDCDHQTSDVHHPDHVLIRREHFDALRAALSKARPSRGEADDCGDEDEDDDELFLPCEICGEEHPEGVLDGDRCPACVDLDDEEGA